MFVYFRLPIPWRQLAKRTIQETFEDGCPGLAAQLAFYFLLALFPALLFMVALLGFVPFAPALTDAVRRLELVLPLEALLLLRRVLDNAMSGTHGGLVTFAVAGALWSSSSAMTAIITALNTAYDIDEWRPWWKRRLLAIVLTFGLAVFIVLAFVLVVGGTDLFEWLAPYVGLAEVLARAGTVPQWAVAFVLVIVGLDLVYYLAPNADTKWVWVTPGALLATVLWLVASMGFKLYVQNFGNYTAIEGAVGSVVVLMLWFYLSGFALLVGAELNAEIDNAMPTRDDTPQGPGHRKKIGAAAEKPVRHANRLSAQRRLRFLILAVLAAATAPACGALDDRDRVEPAVAPVTPPAVILPLSRESVRFAVIGDSGTGAAPQFRVARQLVAAHSRFPFEFVLMTGDNLYGSEDAVDYRQKFEEPYKPLLDAGVKFYASLGNHDDRNQIFYKPFHMDGKRFYTFQPHNGVRVFALDSNYMSPEQLQWLEKELSGSKSEWKIAFFHHPLYSTGGRHGSDVRLRERLEPLFVKFGVDVVFSGHEHFYERLRPQRGVQYFTSGAAAKLREGDIEGGPIHAKGFDQGYSFMLVEIVDDVMHFQVISGQGKTVDSGAVANSRTPANGASAAPAGW